MGSGDVLSGDTDELAASFGEGDGLCQGGVDVLGRGIGHGLDADRGGAADGEGSGVDGTSCASWRCHCIFISIHYIRGVLSVFKFNGDGLLTWGGRCPPQTPPARSGCPLTRLLLGM